MRLGVIGHGRRISGMIRGPFRKTEPDLRVVGIVDPDEAGARARLDECDRKDVKFYRGLGELVRHARLDALAIGTRCNLHTPLAIKAAKYDLPLFLEKPVSVSMRQALALERAYEKSKCPVVVSFPLRFTTVMNKVCDMIGDNAIGRPEHIQAHNYVPYGRCYWEQGYRDYEVTQGLFLQKATHDFDYIAKLMGSRITRVAAMATIGHIFGGKKAAGLTCSTCDETETCMESPVNRKRHGQSAADDHACLFSVDCGSPETGTNEDASSCVFELENGAHGVYSQVFYSLRDAGARGAVVSGYDGTLKFDWYQPTISLVKHFEPVSDSIDAPGFGEDHFGGDAALARNFIGIAAGREESASTIWSGLQSVYTCLAAKESLRKGRFVDVRRVGQA